MNQLMPGDNLEIMRKMESESIDLIYLVPPFLSKSNNVIMLDKTGFQKQKFKPGSHTIAVKVIDNEGLEGIECVRVKINGVVME